MVAFIGYVSFQEIVGCSWRVVSATLSEIIGRTRLLYRPYLARWASSTCVRTVGSAAVNRTAWSTPPTHIRPLPLRRARRYQLPEGGRDHLWRDGCRRREQCPGHVEMHIADEPGSVGTRRLDQVRRVARDLAGRV
jgi:hypothetical protein